MNIVLRLVQLLVLLFVIRMIVSSFLARTRGGQARPKPRRQAEQLRGTLVRDPQCGTFVPSDGAITSGRGANVEHFCSATCRDAWLVSHASRSAS